jgi:hypothetical protein
MNGGGFFVYGSTMTHTIFVRPTFSTTAMLRKLTFLTIATLFLACGRSSEPAARWAEVDKASNGAFEAANQAPAPAQAPIDRKIIRTGDLRYEVGDLDVARAQILKQVNVHSGYVEGDDRNDRGSSIDLTMRVRIPADRFDAFLADLNGLGELLDQHINATDVTSQWVDVEARLAAKRKVEERFLAIVDQAKTVTEVLEVERELGNVRAEIESMEAQMKALKDQVGMSTLTITCTKPQARINNYTPHFGSALRDGWNYFVRFLEAIVHLWPFMLLFGAIIIWLKRRRGSKKQNTMP